MEEIERCCKRLSLTEKESCMLVLDEEEGGGQGSNKGLYCIGKLWSNRPYHFEALISTMKSLWRPSKGVHASRMEKGRILFTFYSPNDMERVWAGAPWTFDQHVLLLRQLHEEEVPSLARLENAVFWVRAYELPLKWMNEKVARKIGSKIGEVLKVSSGAHGSAGGSYLRMQVELSVLEPLPRGTMIQTSAGVEFFVPFKYERLQAFCYNCGRLGHLEKDCEHETAGGEEAPYGPWMRLSSGDRQGRRIGGVTVVEYDVSVTAKRNVASERGGGSGIRCIEEREVAKVKSDSRGQLNMAQKGGGSKVDLVQLEPPRQLVCGGMGPVNKNTQTGVGNYVHVGEGAMGDHINDVESGDENQENHASPCNEVSRKEVQETLSIVADSAGATGKWKRKARAGLQVVQHLGVEVHGKHARCDEGMEIGAIVLGECKKQKLMTTTAEAVQQPRRAL